MRSVNGAETFETVAGVEEAFQIGFGKAAPEAEYPALYLEGRVDGVFGFFRSVDEGQSWIRINDDDHQFGASNAITGDPRIFGRVYIATGGRGIIYGDPVDCRQ